MKPLRILMLGDIVGRPGRYACRDRIDDWREKFSLDYVIANCENASGGNGLSVKNAGELFSYGIDFMTSGNHIWKQNDYEELFERFSGRIIRPANYPEGVPGSGYGFIDTGGGIKIGMLNLLGQVFMDPIDSPFTAADKYIPKLREFTPVIIVDIHAEATSERVAMGKYLDGKVTAVLGTHTHVATSDTRILPHGTAFQADIGMVGPHNGILGVDPDKILKIFLTGLPSRFDIAKGTVICNGVILSIDSENSMAVGIERFEEILER
jgi:metallophosphoesterase (TIGR00282 family)